MSDAQRPTAERLDQVLGTLRESVREGRLSANSPIAAASPFGRWEWTMSLRVAGKAEPPPIGRSAAISAREARTHSVVHQSLAARDAHVPSAEATGHAGQAARAAQRDSNRARPEGAGKGSAARRQEPEQQQGPEEAQQRPRTGPGHGFGR